MKKEDLIIPAFGALLEAPMLAIAAVDREGRVILWSPSAAHMFGWTESEVLGRPMPIVPEDQRHVFLDRVQRSLRGEVLSALEVRRLGKDGAYLDLSVWTAPLRNGPDEVFGVLGVMADITARKKAEEALHQTEADLHRVLGAVSDYLWSGEIDRQGRIRYRYYSPAVERITGRPPEFFLAGPERWLSSIHPEDRRRLVEALGRIQNGRSTSEEEEYRMIRTDGTIRWVRDSATVSPAADGGRRLDGVVSDVTARKQTEETLRESEERFRSMFTEAAIPTALQSLDGRYLQVNRAYCEYLGYSEAELLATTFAAVTHPEDRVNTTDIPRGRLLKGEIKVYQAEKRYVHKLGHVVWGALHVSVVRNAAGAPRYLVAQVQDITDRKQAEESLQRAHDELEQRVKERTKELVRANAALIAEVGERQLAEEALRQSEAKYRSLVEEIPAITYVASLDEVSTTLYVSPQVEPLLGFTPADYRANPHTLWLDRLHPDDRERVLAELHRTHTEHEPFDCEYRMLRRDGGIVWFRDRAVLVRDAAGHPLFLQGVMLDVTERKQLEREILEVSSREQRRIGEDLHDSLCQQLTGIAFLCKTMREKLAARGLPETVDAQEIGRLLNTSISEARDLARGLCPVELGKNDLGLVLKDLSLSVERLYAVSCSVRCQRPVRVKDEAAAIHLYRIAQEAVSNAMHHGKAKHIRIEVARRKGGLTLCVRDDGLGFSTRRRPTQGMGIRIMKHRAAMIGATLAVESKRGAGTSVTCVYNQSQPPAR